MEGVTYQKNNNALTQSVSFSIAAPQVELKRKGTGTKAI